MTTKTLSSSEARKSFYGILREVVDDAVPVVIRNRGRGNAVLISEDEYNSIIETLYVTSGRNGEELRRSMAQARAGQVRTISLDEIDKMLAE